MVVGTAMPGQVDQYRDPQHNPFVARYAPWEEKEIRQGRYRQENKA